MSLPGSRTVNSSWKAVGASVSRGSFINQEEEKVALMSTCAGPLIALPVLRSQVLHVGKDFCGMKGLKNRIK